ncbi:NfeD family protein [Paraglaciecola hydrolytica]|uniref:Activity regulator of membrane protease YbbK n=1 Tax=Paraglaciecola hydrolytica TaxID=1799789 RepID=A0A136A4F6_9ALTE|nr:NfeD family protein [Paraglaciecola hydrolytica]KXI30128.1 activity regulator of membrane protease YbbK [Paraglaciecola hydrolytica]
MEWVSNNLAESLLILGLALLAIEIAVLGFSTFVLFFVGLAAAITGVLLYVGLFPETITNAAMSVAILTALAAIILWKPLKKLQSKVDKTKAKGDLVGHSFVLTETVSPEHQAKYRYSGIEWKLISSETLVAGTKVEVSEAAVGVFYIKAQ